jgi:hypothetical protein
MMGQDLAATPRSNKALMASLDFSFRSRGSL